MLLRTVLNINQQIRIILIYENDLIPFNEVVINTNTSTNNKLVRWSL